jgi:hypothetical protein
MAMLRGSDLPRWFLIGKGTAVLDIFYILLVCGFFAAAAIAVRLCERI